MRFDKTERILRALANKTSIAIVSAILKYGEACACELVPALNMSQPLVTTYLRKLYFAGILKKREHWRYAFYSINEDYRALLTRLPIISQSTE